MIAIRVDSSYQIGTGHVMRCLSLADALSHRGHDVVFICRALVGNIAERIEKRGFRVVLLPAPQLITEQSIDNAEDESETPSYQHWLGVTQLQDADETAALIRTLAQTFDVLIVDHYALDCLWERQIKTVLSPMKFKLLAIDDLRRVHDVELLLDQTLDVSADDYSQSDISERGCFGVEYALLRTDFHQARLSIDKQAPKEHRLLITLGGIDPDNVTEQVVTALYTQKDMLSAFAAIDILAPNSLKHHASLRATVEAFESSPFRLIPFVDDMARFLSEYTLCIGAPGSSCWERSCLGLPSVLIPIADNQKHITQAMAKASAAVILSVSEIDKIAEALNTLLASWSGYQQRALRLCDGLGVNRVVHALEENGVVYLRRAQAADVDLLYTWQTSETTRRYARNKAVPDYGSHCQWLEKKLLDSDCYFYIICHGSHPAGTVRLDRVLNSNDEHAFEVSIHLAPESIGRGVAKRALSALAAVHQDITIHAHVLSDNIASQKLFERANYQRVDAENFVLVV